MDRTLFLNTTEDHFANWLDEVTKRIWMHAFPTDNGRITLQRAIATRNLNDVLVVSIHGMYMYQSGPDTETATWPINMITFRAIPLAEERIEVHAECFQPAVIGYFQELLAEITKRWPQPTTERTRGDYTDTLNRSPLSLTIDDIDSFAEVRHVVRESVKQQLPLEASEAQIKHLFHSIVEDPFPKKDWGGEQNDIFTSRLVLDGQRRYAAFFLKGPATKGKLTIAKCGKNGDQLQRLFQSPAEIFIIQYNGEVDERVIEEAKQKVENLRSRGREAVFTVVDGYDTARLMLAYAGPERA
jgi:hypothetical protein